MPTDAPGTVNNQLRIDLLAARKAHDSLVSTTLQATIAAIDNAGAVPIQEATHSVGVGSTEVPRRELSASDIKEIIKQEVAELQYAITEFGDIQNDYTNDLRSKVTILNKYI
jgi:hypothetical protein